MADEGIDPARLKNKYKKIYLVSKEVCTNKEGSTKPGGRKHIPKIKRIFI
jgi:hypothetical protein